ncbi:c-type cytochrome biogenesis protein CcmI [Pararhizobium sp.]|uniref:c-type cytochrome biogenesis protein CcmI n=1 Tax=Pararhizobium sp. TaxID=1977563 RepID=UPI0027221CFE|nr:c-type cytochrome biogenesis protein CcmI [Pararhizobium sp.]MDO9417991.1 c-type cytochrome biogenesis protein CcmI [Pararhizobium sp.]
MVFWILVAVLTAAVAILMLLPLLRARAAQGAERGHDAEVYRDQLQELDRDLKNGLIGTQEAEFARAEIGRRLLGAKDQPGKPAVTSASRSNRIAQALVIVALPAIGLCLYLTTGNPDVPDRPLAERLANPGDDISILIARAEQHLIKNPNDAAGWDLLAPIYYREGRMEAAANAFDQAVKIAGPTPERLGGLSESLIALAGGIITPPAQEALKKLLVAVPGDPRASFYLALALKQEGKSEEARTAFNALIKASPKDAPWLPLVNDHLAELDAAKQPPSASSEKLGNPTSEDVAAAAGMEAGDRQAMIRGMVDSLTAKLQENPDNFDGWMRLIRSHVVLNDKDKAAAALKQGLAAFPATGEQGKQLLALAQELGLPKDGATQ